VERVDKDVGHEIRLLSSSHATIVRTIDDPRLRSPSTAVNVDGSLWVVNSRLAEIFHGATDPSDAFSLVRVNVGP